MSAATKVSARIQEVRDLSKQDPSKAASSYQKILSEGPGSTEASSRDYEHALIGLGQLYRDAKKPQEIADLIKTSRDTFSSFAKAKTAKLGKRRHQRLGMIVTNHCL
jgi:SWI/SNF-related matrix-associated actin-dependent regulator of chromatin subfamily D